MMAWAMGLFKGGRHKEGRLHVLVGSLNPVKVGAAQDAFRAYFPDARAEGIAVPSGVPDQPVGEATYEGARNRADALYRKRESEALDGDFFVGIEGGVIQHVGRWFSFGAVCVVDARGRTGFGASPLFELPAGKAIYAQGTVVALVPFLNEALFFPPA